MSNRIQADWLVLDSLEDASGQFCIDFFHRPDGSYGFEAFRRAAEDQGLWEPLSHYSILQFTELRDCLHEAINRFEWLADSLADPETIKSYLQRIAAKRDSRSGLILATFH